MGIDARVPNNDPATPCWTVRHVVQMLQAACPNHWRTVLRNCLGSTSLANLTPAEFAKFTEYVFWVVKQYGIRDPAAFLTYQVQLEAEAAPAEFGSPPKIGDIPVQSKSAEREPGRNNSSTPRLASPPGPMAGTLAWGTTKAEVLSRAKAAVEGGEDLRVSAERLASAQEDFHASLREIGREIGRSASWISRLLKWRQSGYKQSSPFGPTTRAARAARRNGPGGFGGPRDSDDDDKASLVPQCCSPADQPASRRAAVNPDLLSEPTQTDLVSSTEAATREIQPPETETAPLDDPAHKPERNASRQLDNQMSSARKPSAAQKLSPERMRIVFDALKECPILVHAAAKAGIHRKTLAYWLRCSEAGRDGYDIEWDDVPLRFHEFCQCAIEEAHDMLSLSAYQVAFGVTIKFDGDGKMIKEVVGPLNPKMIRFLLEWQRPEKWGKRRDSNIPRTGGVLVIGARPKDAHKGWASSVRARRWKSMATKLGKAKP